MFLSILIYPLHLWFVNLAVGLPLLSLWLELAGRNNDAAWRLNRQLTRAAWMALLIGSLLGLIHLAVIWDESWSDKVAYAGSRIMFGVIELLTSLLLIVIYGVLLRRQRPTSKLGGIARWLVPFVASTNLLYHFPVLFGVLKRIDVAAVGDGSKLTSAAFRSYVVQGEVIANWLHFLMASLAIGGAVSLWMAIRVEKRDQVTIQPNTTARLAIVSAAGTLMQWIVGPLVFVFERRHVQIALSGGDLLITGWFMQTMLLAMLLSFLQVRMVFNSRAANLTSYVIVLQLAVVFAMSLVRLLYS